ncbi:hypothetical protein SPLC1_S530250 [Arthrospira platensis C1]|uniref:Uncharacterized protein n=1 Tax=Limnospira maxima CS-328 TaxID=513049 RepID=B5W682_LIMMA|nr:hypothetical protein AmaxDRAFT_4281 [Limnospira maxima CS-328]EKD06434.1 hypothetical protein SPLC1_S530250 [Arthrospira platensis C1]UWU48469.1 hypothetical protein APLC1_3264 [Arthrospira platensis C1]
MLLLFLDFYGFMNSQIVKMAIDIYAATEKRPEAP